MSLNKSIPQTYEYRPETVRAIQFDGSNYREISNFLMRYRGDEKFSDIRVVQGEGLRNVGQTICLRSKGFERDVEISDWIVDLVYSDGLLRSDDDAFPVWGDIDFCHQFRHASEYIR